MKLSGPRAVLGCADRDGYVRRYDEFVRLRGHKPAERTEPLVMYVNEGRWVADCTHCRAGVTGEPDWPDVRCLGCGSVHTNVVWPDAFDDIEGELEVRPVANQHWLASETVEDLSAQNVERGVRSPLADAVALADAEAVEAKPVEPVEKGKEQ